MQAKQIDVPRGTVNPIDDMVTAGWTEPQLAVAWELRSAETVRKLRKYHHVPSYDTASRMAKTFGWSSAGEVMDFYASKVTQSRQLRAERLRKIADKLGVSE